MTLRDDIRGGFDRQQAKLGEVGDARHRLMQDGLAARESVSRRVQWAAGIAAVLIAALVIGTFALVRGNIHPQTVPGTTPKASASPTQLQNALNVSDSTPVIVYHDPANFDQVDGVTWDGKRSGRIGTGAANGGIPNPQGTLYAASNEIRDRHGAVLATFDPINVGVFWSDDGRSYCSVVRTASRDMSSPGELQLTEVGKSPRNVARVGSFKPASHDGGGPSVVACSPGGDRAVVYQSGGQGIGVMQFWVVQLSSGRTLWTGGVGGYIAASHDGRYVALADGSGHTVIYGPGGAVLKRLEGEVFGFSLDGALVVAAQIGGAQSPSIVNWSDGQTIWTCPDSTFGYWGSFAEPGGSQIAIGVLDPAYPQTGGFAPVDLFVVGADGIVSFELKDVTLFSQ